MRRPNTMLTPAIAGEIVARYAADPRVWQVVVWNASTRQHPEEAAELHVEIDCHYEKYESDLSEKVRDDLIAAYPEVDRKCGIHSDGNAVKIGIL